MPAFAKAARMEKFQVLIVIFVLQIASTLAMTYLVEFATLGISW